MAYGDVDWSSFFGYIPDCISARPVFVDDVDADIVLCIAVQRHFDLTARNEAEIIVRHGLNDKAFGEYEITKKVIVGFEVIQKAKKTVLVDSPSTSNVTPGQVTIVPLDDLPPDFFEVLSAFIDALDEEYVEFFSDWDALLSRRHCGVLEVQVLRDATGVIWVRISTHAIKTDPKYIEARNMPTKFVENFREMAARAGAETRPRPTDYE